LSFNGDLNASDDGLELETKGQIHTYSTENTALDVGSNDYVLTADSTTATGLAWLDSGSIKHQVALVIACSDEETAIDATGQKISFRMPYAMTLNAGTAGITGSLVTAGTGANLFTVDINESGSTILSTKLTFDATETTTTTAATPVVISDTALAADSIITIDVDQLDSGGVAAGLKISLIGSVT
jgi:hypothetical protein